MNIHFLVHKGNKLGELISENMAIQTAQDALELVANCAYQEAGGVIVQEKNMNPAFFDLKSGLAGEMLQKFSNYRLKLAIWVIFLNIWSARLFKDFMYESNKFGNINFVSSVEEAKEKLILNT